MEERPDSQRTLQAPASFPEGDGASDIAEFIQLGRLSLEVSAALNEGTTLSRVLTACTEALVRHLDAAFARVWVLNEDAQVLELQASSGMYTHLNGGHARVPVGALKIGRIAATRQPHLTNTVIGDPHVSNQDWARQEGMVAFAGYPLLVGDKLIGVMAVFARHTLHAAALQAMASVANGIALGVERLRMLDERARLLAREQAARQDAENAQQRLYSLFMQAPALICVLRGPEHIYELANPLYLQLVGQNAILGKPLREAAPKVEGLDFSTVLNGVYTTGMPFVGHETKAQIVRSEDGLPEEGYFNFIYQPSRASAGEVDGVLIYAVEVTEQVQAREAIRQQQQRLELAQRSASIGTFEWNIRDNAILWTPELERLYGLPPGGFEGKYENWARRVHPDDLERAEANLREAVTGESMYNAEFRVVWPDGTTRWLLGKGELIASDQQGQPLKMIGVNIDITQRREAEQQRESMYERLQELNAHLEALVAQRTAVLQQLNIDLQRSNQELQDFAYVASHDLQEPLRKIQAFGNLLADEYGEALGEDGSAYVDRMRNAATRMRVLIEDLLTFSRVTTKAQPFVAVNLNAVVDQAVDDLEPRLRESGGRIEVGPLPTLEADAGQMYQLFQNLLSNALKFQRPGVAPVVKVTATLLDQEPAQEQLPQCLIRVEDNGIGFDEKYLDRIFTVFQRLHGRDRYEGTGVGLAVVKKIADRHGGMVTATSVIGEGSTFLVTLPLATPVKEETSDGNEG